MAIGERISARLAELGLSQAELARRVGLAQPTINALINRNKVGSKHLHKIARELQTTPSYLTGEADNPAEGFVPAPSNEVVAEQLGLVEVREIDLSLGMGATYIDVPVTETMRHFSRDWLRLYTHSSPDNLLFAQGLGDSMSPTLLDSDMLLIDCAQRSITISDKIWAIAYANCGAVKRLRPLPNGGIKMTSDNPLVPDDIAYDDEMQVLGRVVAVIRKV